MGLLEEVISILSLVAYLLGSILLLAVFISLVFIILVLLLLAYSFKTGNFLFPNLMIILLVFFESPVKSVLRILRIDESRMDRMTIYLRNRAMCPSFRKVPFNKRAIFVPQCLRAMECPARLSPEGMKCKGCGACEIDKAQKLADKLGYMFFVVPGSSFIVRMIKKYQPQAIIGIGCLCEVKEGLDLMHKYKITAMGMILERSGCVATELKWDKLYRLMELYDYSDNPHAVPGTESPGEGKHTPPTS